MKKVLMYLGITATAAFFGTAAFASVNDDQVTSQKIREADGTSGQSTNSGSGVKTGHIQDGAVTDAKIGGTISPSKVNGLEASLAGKADVIHNHDVLYQQKYGKVAVVAQTGGDYTDPVTAMNDLGSWCGTPSETNPCLLRIMPGIYAITLSLNMSQYVDIVGSGEGVTKIKGSFCSAALWGASHAEVRNITIENASTGACSITYAIYNNASSPRFTNVTAIVSGEGQAAAIYNWTATPKMTNVSSSATAGTIAYGMINTMFSATEVQGGSFSASGAANQNIGIANAKSDVKMANLTVTASGQNGVGIQNSASTSTLNTSLLQGVRVTSSGIGIQTLTNSGMGTVTSKIYDSSITGTTNKITMDGSSNTYYINNTQLQGGPIVYNGGVVKCHNAFDENFDPLVCQ